MWLEGYITARNVIGHEGVPLKVAGGLSPDALIGLVQGECDKHPLFALWQVAGSFYEFAKAKGL